MRAPYQVLVFPYIITPKGEVIYCIFKRKDLKVWQGIAGGGEKGETPLKSAKREAFEEAGISAIHKFIKLDSISSIPVEAIGGAIWGKNILVIPEYSFGVEVKTKNIRIKNEHSAYKWMNYKNAIKSLKWDSNKTALWELNYRLTTSKFNK